MSLLEKASLVITPNAYKASKLYSVVPNTTLGDMDVVRATTATRVNSAGLIESVASNVPRIDYSNGSCPSILVEPQSTNLITHSSTFTNAVWTQDNSSLTSGFTSPSGAADAFKLIESATTAVHNIYITFASLALGNYTTSIYIKKGERFKVAIADRNSGVYVSYNLNTETIIDTLSLVGTIESLDNDWYRLTATTTSTVNVYVPQFFILQDSYTTGLPITLPYLGDGTSGIYIWGSQFELGSYATSLIPTTSATVTRNADLISKTGISSLIGQTEGTIFVEFNYNSIIDSSTSRKIMSLNDGGSDNMIDMFIQQGSTSLHARLRNGGVGIGAITTGALSSGNYKLAYAYKNSYFVLYINGVQIGSVLSGTISFTSPVGIVQIGDGDGTSDQLGGLIKTAVIFKTRLSNTELAQLTTI